MACSSSLVRSGARSPRRARRRSLLAGCASSTQLDAQWTRPAARRATSYLSGSAGAGRLRRLRAVVRQICQDQLAAEVSAAAAATPRLPAARRRHRHRPVDRWPAAARGAQRRREGGAGAHARRRPSPRSARACRSASAASATAAAAAVGVGVGRAGRRRPGHDRAIRPTAASPMSQQRPAGLDGEGASTPPSRESTRRSASCRRRCSARPTSPACSEARAARGAPARRRSGVERARAGRPRRRSAPRW